MMTKATSDSRPDQKVLVTMLLIFLLALGVRLLVWQHNRAAIEQVMTQLTLTYKEDARVLGRGDWRLFVRGANPPSDANVLAHPPGYPMLAALLFALTGESDAALRLFQLLCDAVAVVFVFLIALELLSPRVAVLAGVLAALSPQLAYNSLLLLPDSLAVLPILLAVYLFIRAAKHERGWINLLAAGALLGLSCWLRPNALALPLFMAGLTPFVYRRGRRWRAAVALVGASLLIVAPLTLRNLLVFKRFVPVSLGSGVTMLEGIADYDRKGELGLPQTDMEVLQQEAKIYNRQDYAGSLYNPDGIERERERAARGLAVIRAHPFWFAGVMARRAASMLRMERVPVIAGSPLKLEDAAKQTSLTARLLKVPGVPLKIVQKLFITALMLPLFLVGGVLLVKEKEKRALAVLLVVPVYYLSVQSLLHTEYRYVIAIQYFFLVIVAVTLDRAGAALQRRVRINK
jgi:4-amino-4-deoxy-L-arabinose transferase-like glycosyltransferase